jgi:hypothetical protein
VISVGVHEPDGVEITILEDSGEEAIDPGEIPTAIVEVEVGSPSTIVVEDVDVSIQLDILGHEAPGDVSTGPHFIVSDHLKIDAHLAGTLGQPVKTVNGTLTNENLPQLMMNFKGLGQFYIRALAGSEEQQEAAMDPGSHQIQFAL